MSTPRTSARLLEKYKSKPFLEVQNSLCYLISSDSSSGEEEYQRPKSVSSTPKNIKLRTRRVNGKKNTPKSEKIEPQLPKVQCSEISSDSSFSEDYVQPKLLNSTPKKTKLISEEVNCSPLKQSRLETPKNQKKSNITVNTPSLESLSIKSPIKPNSTRKSLFKENFNDEKDDSEDDTDLIHKNKSVYQSARKALHGSLPVEMPARENELEQLRKFIINHLTNKTSGSLYISGPPGTGKTASLNTILKDENLDSTMIHVYINCTAIKSPTAIYSRIIKELKLKPNGKTEKEHLAQINSYLKRKHKPILLVLDEIDQLESKNQSILYTIFEWPSTPNSEIILIGIANALDLTDRILPRLHARCELKPELMHYAPYTKSQIVEIFTSRLKSAGVLEMFAPAAVQMLAGKVAAVSGDVRRALDIGRRVIELAEQSGNSDKLKSVENLANKLVDDEIKSVDLKQVLTVLNNVYSTSQNFTENDEHTFPLQQKIIICSLLLMLRNMKNKDITVGKLHEIYRKVCDKRKIGSVEQSEFVGLCNLIETRGMISITGKKDTRLNKVNLMWDEEEVTAALKDKQLVSDILYDTSYFKKS